MGCHRVLKQLPSAICHHRGMPFGQAFPRLKASKEVFETKCRNV